MNGTVGKAIGSTRLQPHHLPQRLMLVGQIVQPIPVLAAAVPHRRQHQDLPVAHPRSSLRGTRLSQHVLLDQSQHLLQQVLTAVQLLQPRQQRHQFMPAVQVQLHRLDPSRCRPAVPSEGLTHRFAPGRRLGQVGHSFPPTRDLHALSMRLFDGQGGKSSLPGPNLRTPIAAVEAHQ